MRHSLALAKPPKPPRTSLRRPSPGSLSAIATDQLFTQTNAPPNHCPPRVPQYYHVETLATARTSQSAQCALAEGTQPIHVRRHARAACVLVFASIQHTQFPSRAPGSTKMQPCRDRRPTCCTPQSTANGLTTAYTQQWRPTCRTSHRGPKCTRKKFGLVSTSLLSA